jgi:hypothetical protein
MTRGEKDMTSKASAPSGDLPAKGSDAGCDGEGSRGFVLDALDEMFEAFVVDNMMMTPWQIEAMQKAQKLLAPRWRISRKLARQRARCFAVQPDATPADAPAPVDPRQRKADASEPPTAPHNHLPEDECGPGCPASEAREFYCGCEHHRIGPDARACWDEDGCCTSCGVDVDPWTIRALQAEIREEELRRERDSLLERAGYGLQARVAEAEAEASSLRRALGLAAEKFDLLGQVEAGAACRRDGERALSSAPAAPPQITDPDARVKKGFRIGIEAAARAVEMQVTASHFTAQTQMAIVDVIRACAAPAAPGEDHEG